MPLKFSIVVPSYNQAGWLEACLRSVIGQTGVALEIIVMDGGSTDGSREIIEKYAAHFAYWQSQKDGGQAAAIRAGFERATGDVYGWLNSDDVYMPGALAKVARFLESRSEEDVVTGGGFFIDAKGEFLRRRLVNHTLGVAASHDRFLYFRPQQGIWQPATFWRRAAYEAVGGVDPQFHYIMDFDLFTRLSARRPFAVLPEVLACFRIHEFNKTHAWLDVFHREKLIWDRKYGVDRTPLWDRYGRYARHLVPAVAEKVRAFVRERVGAVALEAPRW